MKQFNINHHVYVKLTDLGLAHWKKQFKAETYKNLGEKYTFEDHYKRHLMPDGWVQFQLHGLIDVFGSSTFSAEPNYFETTIRFNEKDLKNISLNIKKCKD